jgi:hypothetical protein
MDARRALLITNDKLNMRPFVVLAIKVMGPGRRRLEMVKLAHDMNDSRVDEIPFQARLQGGLQVAADRRPQAAPAGRRAA